MNFYDRNLKHTSKSRGKANYWSNISILDLWRGFKLIKLNDCYKQYNICKMMECQSKFY